MLIVNAIPLIDFPCCSFRPVQNKFISLLLHLFQFRSPVPAYNSSHILSLHSHPVEERSGAL